MALIKGTTGRIGMSLTDKKTGLPIQLQNASEILFKIRRETPTASQPSYVVSLNAAEGDTVTIGSDSYIVDAKGITVDNAPAGLAHAEILPSGMDLVQAQDGASTDCVVLVQMDDGTVLGVNLPGSVAVESQLC